MQIKGLHALGIKKLHALGSMSPPKFCDANTGAEGGSSGEGEGDLNQDSPVASITCANSVDAGPSSEGLNSHESIATTSTAPQTRPSEFSDAVCGGGGWHASKGGG